MAETTPAGPTPAAGQPNGAAPDWLAGVAPEQRGMAELKGWKSPADVFTSYANLEKYHGVPPERLVRLPENLDDTEALASVYGRLGRPEKPEGYGIEGADAELLAALHKHGLTTRQVKGLHEVLTARSKTAQEAAEKQRFERVDVEMTALKREWGPEYDRRIRQGQAVAEKVYAAMGYATKEEFEVDLEALQAQMGPAKVLKLFAELGKGSGEQGFVEGDPAGANGNGGFAVSKNTALAKLSALAADPDFQAKLRSPVDAVRKAALSERARWSDIAYG